MTATATIVWMTATKLNDIAKITSVYHFVSRTKTRDKIATMYDMLIIYSSKKDTLESVET